jgi:hypothetical protein
MCLQALLSIDRSTAAATFALNSLLLPAERRRCADAAPRARVPTRASGWAVGTSGLLASESAPLIALVNTLSRQSEGTHQCSLGRLA